MAFDLDTAKARLKIAPADTTSDTVIAEAMIATIAIAENYCKRRFERKLEVEIFPHFHGTSVSLRRYPILHVGSVSDTENASRVMKYQINSAAGLIDFHGYTVAENLVVEYDAGYDPLPADLEVAFWAIFDNVYAASSGGGGGVTGAIDSITIPDVGTVRYSSGASAAAANTNGGAGVYGSFYNLLDNYVLHGA